MKNSPVRSAKDLNYREYKFVCYIRGCAISLQPVLSISPDRSDEDLVRDTQGGSDQAFELLMRRHSGTVRSLILHFCRDRSMVDDLAQETFVKAFFKMKSFRGDSPFIFWLKKIAVCACLDHYRYDKARRNISWKSSLPEEDYLQKAEAAPNMESGRQMEARLLIEEILSKLEPPDRMILVLLYGEGHEIREISKLTGLSRANVKIRAYRIRRQLNKQYAGGLR
ncbi:MAG: RNA polymerase sigma factor [Acidobacteria bacterium]|nr:RNA polymerase sigma factor [Acidobacteriota bacterium]